MKGDDIIKSEDLLSNKEELNRMISEGEAKPSHEEKAEDTAPKTEETKPREVVKVHSDNPNMKWYIVYVRTGQETKAKEQLEQKIKAQGRQSDFSYVLVPTENIVEVAKGKKRTATRKFFPGYMLVQMVMNEENWHFVKGTPRIVGFVGNNVNPPAVNESEVIRITSQAEEGMSKPVPKMSFEEGENVRVIEGPFTNFTGIVEEVKPDKAKLKVLVSIFGRSTPVELEFVQVEKI
jgi:transcription termination/antitermination protein NusG